MMNVNNSGNIIINTIKDYLRKSWVIKPIRAIRKYLSHLPYYGRGLYCPVCEKSSRKFADQYSGKMCIYCESQERHRLLWLYFEKATDLFDGKRKKMLHIAPEECLTNRLKILLRKDEYITADLENPKAMVKMDITKIQYPDNYFDVILCSHVLEHIQDDKLAMSEIRRVLKKDGWAILLVPITTEKTIEDPLVIDPDERLRLFGQKDHVRLYGFDYIERLFTAGFNVNAVLASDLFSENELLRMKLIAPGDKYIYHCTKD